MRKQRLHLRHLAQRARAKEKNLKPQTSTLAILGLFISVASLSVSIVGFISSNVYHQVDVGLTASVPSASLVKDAATKAVTFKMQPTFGFVNNGNVPVVVLGIYVTSMLSPKNKKIAVVNQISGGDTLTFVLKPGDALGHHLLLSSDRNIIFDVSRRDEKEQPEIDGLEIGQSVATVILFIPQIGERVVFFRLADFEMSGTKSDFREKSIDYWSKQLTSIKSQHDENVLQSYIPLVTGSWYGAGYFTSLIFWQEADPWIAINKGVL